MKKLFQKAILSMICLLSGMGLFAQNGVSLPQAALT